MWCRKKPSEPAVVFIYGEMPRWGSGAGTHPHWPALVGVRGHPAALTPSAGLSCKTAEGAPCPKCSFPELKPGNGKCVAMVCAVAGGIATCCPSALSLTPSFLVHPLWWHFCSQREHQQTPLEGNFTLLQSLVLEKVWLFKTSTKKNLARGMENFRQSNCSLSQLWDTLRKGEQHETRSR